MARYRFHATNGLECVFDARGKDIGCPSVWRVGRVRWPRR